VAALSFSSINYRKLCRTTESLIIHTQCVEVLKIPQQAWRDKKAEEGGGEIINR
jgi:hypothetical protein